MMEPKFVFLDEVLHDVRWDAKYATWDNFTGRPVDGYGLNRVAGTYELAMALLKVKNEANKLGYGLLLWDGYRPQRAVNDFLLWAQKPEDGRTKGKFYPNIAKTDMFEKGYVAKQSSHSRGSAIDLTLYELQTGDILSMGSEFDFMDELSHHGATNITSDEKKHREILRMIMETCGFEAYAYEWWHYVLKKEPYLDTYFDVSLTEIEHGQIKGVNMPVAV